MSDAMHDVRQDRYPTVTREMIRHENNVTNHRIMWLLVSTLQRWTVTREYVDHETGSTNDRTQFQAMFRDASQRKFDVLLFWALDRLSREGVLETLQHLNRLTACSVGYRSFSEQYFDPAVSSRTP
jgi:DNA invertase Pin-like site-specific DNA recombinase